MENPIKVKLTAMYEFSTLEEAEAFADFKKYEDADCEELCALDIQIIAKSKQTA